MSVGEVEASLMTERMRKYSCQWFLEVRPCSGSPYTICKATFVVSQAPPVHVYDECRPLEMNTFYALVDRIKRQRGPINLLNGS